MYVSHLQELKSKTLLPQSSAKLVLVFKASTKKKKKGDLQNGTIQLSQDHRFGFIGLPSQEKELRAQGMLYVGEDKVTKALFEKNNSLDKLLMNPSSLSFMERKKRESLAFWKRFPLNREDGFVYHIEQVHKHRGKEFSLQHKGNHSVSIPFGELHWDVSLLDQHLVSLIKQLQQEIALPIKNQFLLNNAGGKVMLPKLF